MAGRSLAGMLDPTNAPGPTMHSLEEIYQKLDSIAGTLTTNVGSAYPALVAKTGQTNSLTSGDDGDLRKGMTWPTPRFTVQANTNVVLDNLTSLMWARNANLPGGATNWSDAVSYCKTLAYGSYSDWRLPNVRELQSLIDFSQYSPVLPPDHPFTDVQSDYYWSSTTYTHESSSAWHVLLSDGYTYYSTKGTLFYVWPVRGGQ
ncbi:MAG: DUF1566 domain-containing protein [bacterium]